MTKGGTVLDSSDVDVAEQQRFTLFRPTRERLLAVAWVLAGMLSYLAVTAWVSHGLGHDAHAYWIVEVDPAAYGGRLGEPDAFLYSPLFAQVAQLVTWLPWPVFVGLWTAAAVATYLWLVRPLRWVWAVPLLVLAIEDTTLGNITWLLALLAVAGMRRPVWWVPVVFTKGSAGVGLLWHVTRRNWRGVGVAVLVGGALLGVSYAASPEMWVAYLELMRDLGGPGIAVRTLLAAALVVFAARTDRPWLVPVALVICAPLPIAYTWAYLLAVPRLLPEAWVERLNQPFGGFKTGVRRGLDLPV